MRARGEPATVALLKTVLGGLEDVPAHRLTHPFHAWPGRMHPELARRVIAATGGAHSPGRPGRRVVLDPFMGGGTVLVEAMAAGCAAIGVDINPVSLLIAQARTALPSPAEREAFVATAREISRTVFEGARRKVSVELSSAARSQARWYGPHVLQELQTLADAVAAVPDPARREWLRAVFSSLLVKLSNQVSDSRGEVQRKQVGRGTASTLFGRRAEELAHLLEAFATAVPPGTPTPRLVLGDARELPGIAPASVDLVLTSPPYPGTYDYLEHQARRLPWLGMDALRAYADERELGARRHEGPGAGARWHADLMRWLGACARVLRPGGEAFLVIGDGLIEGVPWRADLELEEAAPRAGFIPVAVATQDRPHHHPRAERAYGGRPRGEHLVVLRLPVQGGTRR